jgi:hypothetical protein
MEISDEDRPSEEIIRVMSPSHCARGPKGCEECKEAAKTKKICLLRVFFDHGYMARPMIELERKGERILLEYDVLRVFQNIDEALEYAKKNNLTDIIL